MQSLLLRNLSITDSKNTLEGDVLLKDGKIAAIGKGLSGGTSRVIEGGGRTLLPSFVDLHAHFRDPGLTYKEDITSGCQAAVHGGYTTVSLMGNTKPVCSLPETVDYVLGKAKKAGLCDIHQVVSITNGFGGKDLSHLEQLHKAVRWLSDDGVGVADTAVMRKAMELAKEKGVGVMLHEEDAALTGIDSALAEELMTFRDVQLARLTGCKTHFCHVSTRKAMEYIIAGKRDCPFLTCEVTPHHLYLNNKTPGKVAPPLRPEADRLFLIECVKAGMVDAIATDHAPHTPEDKAAGANGFTGLDLSFATCFTALVRPGHITISQLSRLMAANPARLLGVAGGKIAVGEPANLALVDCTREFTVTEALLASKGKNTPLLGQRLWGQVRMTIKEGEIVYEASGD